MFALGKVRRAVFPVSHFQDLSNDGGHKSCTHFAVLLAGGRHGRLRQTNNRKSCPRWRMQSEWFVFVSLFECFFSAIRHSLTIRNNKKNTTFVFHAIKGCQLRNNGIYQVVQQPSSWPAMIICVWISIAIKNHVLLMESMDPMP